MQRCYQAPIPYIFNWYNSRPKGQSRCSKSDGACASSCQGFPDRRKSFNSRWYEISIDFLSVFPRALENLCPKMADVTTVLDDFCHQGDNFASTQHGINQKSKYFTLQHTSTRKSKFCTSEPGRKAGGIQHGQDSFRTLRGGCLFTSKLLKARTNRRPIESAAQRCAENLMFTIGRRRTWRSLLWLLGWTGRWRNIGWPRKVRFQDTLKKHVKPKLNYSQTFSDFQRFRFTLTGRFRVVHQRFSSSSCSLWGLLPSTRHCPGGDPLRGRDDALDDFTGSLSAVVWEPENEIRKSWNWYELMFFFFFNGCIVWM